VGSFKWSKVRPVVSRATGLVYAWEGRLDYEDGGFDGFDCFTLPATGNRRPPEEWTRAEVEALLEAGTRSPRAHHLVDMVEHRRDFMTVDDFDLSRLSYSR